MSSISNWQQHDLCFIEMIEFILLFKNRAWNCLLGVSPLHPTFSYFLLILFKNSLDLEWEATLW